jgi:hypothetical protein
VRQQVEAYETSLTVSSQLRMVYNNTTPIGTRFASPVWSLRDWVNSMPWGAGKISAKPTPNFQSAVRGYDLKLIV